MCSLWYGHFCPVYYYEWPEADVSNKIAFPPDFLKPKLKLSPYRALEFQAVEAPRISGHQHIRVAWLSAYAALTPRRNPWYSFLLRG
jgi:hypothetical protein